VIDGMCRTNLDDYRRVEWPTQFASVPLRGDLVRSLDGRRELMVVRVTHAMKSRDTFNQAVKVPTIIVELHEIR
jgi:hypothetical protein